MMLSPAVDVVVLMRADLEEIKTMQKECNGKWGERREKRKV